MRPDKYRRRAWFVVLVAAVVLLAGCGDDDDSTDAQAGTTTTAGSSGSTTTTTAETTAAPVSTASNPQLGEILVDAEGLTLYVFDNDKDGTIACGAGCTDAWPPLVLESGASLPTTGDLAADLTAVARPDGAQQVAFKGRPLYRYAGDAKPGDTTGDNVANIWHVVKVDGEAASSGGGGGGTTTPY